MIRRKIYKTIVNRKTKLRHALDQKIEDECATIRGNFQLRLYACISANG